MGGVQVPGVLAHLQRDEHGSGVLPSGRRGGASVFGLCLLSGQGVPPVQVPVPSACGGTLPPVCTLHAAASHWLDIIVFFHDLY